MERKDYRLVCATFAESMFAIRAELSDVNAINRALAKFCACMSNQYENFDTQKFCILFWSIYNQKWTNYMEQ